jgi:DNA-binding transcriptional regulator YiaG
MPNLATALKEEIRRLARKETKAQLTDLKAASSRHRKDIAALKRQIQQQERTISRLRKPGAGSATPKATQSDSGPEVRFSPKWVANHREKLELSAADYAALVGVSHLTIYNWEKGKTRPQQKQLHAWGAIKKLGKREAWKRLEEMEG